MCKNNLEQNTMKKLLTLCLLFVISITVNAQDSKPTKEQTMEYIKGYYSDFKVGWWSDKKYDKFSENYKITMIGTKLIIEWDEYSWDGISARKLYEFDLRDIESLGLRKEISATAGNRHCEEEIVFNTVNNKPTIKLVDNSQDFFVNKFSILINNGTDCINATKENQIYKAFNHLRKLCGAPEPISFD